MKFNSYKFTCVCLCLSLVLTSILIFFVFCGYLVASEYFVPISEAIVWSVVCLALTTSNLILELHDIRRAAKQENG